jgi:ABC-type nitrate/sulfonate/bicarbonate transport system ATPase subunit
LLEEIGMPAILVTHNRVEALTLGDRLAVIEGRWCGRSVRRTWRHWPPRR